MSVQPFGFAIRNNGTCGDDLEECGDKTDPFHACCPSGSFCDKEDYNADCCPEKDDCTVELYRDPLCANESWDLYQDPAEGYYFCCEQGLTGFVTQDSAGFGCADPEFEFQNGENDLEPQEDPTATTTPTPGPTTSETPDPESGPPVGPVAGGVVGGVVGLALVAAAIWWFCIRGRKKAEVPPKVPHEAPTEAIHEAPNNKSALYVPPGELDGSAQSQRPTELAT